MRTQMLPNLFHMRGREVILLFEALRMIRIRMQDAGGRSLCRRMLLHERCMILILRTC